MVNKEIWENSIDFLNLEQLPPWPCPSCSSGELKLVEKSFRFKQSAKQFPEEDFRREDFENSVFLGILKSLKIALDSFFWRQMRFSAFLFCQNKSCNEAVVLSGRAKSYNPPHKDDSETIIIYIIPEYFSPPLPIILLKNEYPIEIKTELAKSFSVFFIDSSAAGNKLRTSIEILLDKLSVPKQLNLHKRIEDFNSRRSDLGKKLLAIKWLCNEASHVIEISKRDILDAYEILEYVLDSLFVKDPSRERLEQLSKKLTDKYKPKLRN